MIVDRLGAVPLVMQLPIGAEADFQRCHRPGQMKALVWRDETAKGEMYDTSTSRTRPGGCRGVPRQAPGDGRRVGRRADGAVPGGRRAHPGADGSPASAARSSPPSVTPVFCGTAFKNKGVQPLLDAVVAYLPSPTDVPGVEGHKVGKEETEIVRKASDEEPFSGLAFKIMSDPLFGKLTFIRVYSGRMDSGTPVLNS